MIHAGFAINIQDFFLFEGGVPGRKGGEHFGKGNPMLFLPYEGDLHALGR